MEKWRGDWTQQIHYTTWYTIFCFQGWYPTYKKLKCIQLQFFQLAVGVKLGLSNLSKNRNWVCSRIRCWRRHSTIFCFQGWYPTHKKFKCIQLQFCLLGMGVKLGLSNLSKNRNWERSRIRCWRRHLRVREREGNRGVVEILSRTASWPDILTHYYYYYYSCQ